jgi:ornithine cyclodeaminase
MQVISEETVARVLDYAGVEAALADAFGDLAAGRAAISPRQRIDAGTVKLSTMGGVWLARGVAGIKSYPTIDGQFAFSTTLFDLAAQQACAVLPGGELTRFRTAAMATLAARRMVRGRPRKLVVFGFGLQGRSAAEAVVRAMRPERLVVVDPWAREQAVAEFAAREQIDAQLAAAQDGVHGADLIITATRAKTPVFDGRGLSPGASIVALGTSMPNGSELDAACLSSCARVIVEWKPQSLAEAGELDFGRRQSAITEAQVVDLAELCGSAERWRQDDSEVLLFKSVGVGLSDVAAAWLAKERVEAGA